MKHSTTKRTSSVPVLLSFAAVYVVWGSTYLAIAIGIETIPPFALAGLRFTAAGGILYGFLRLRGEARPTLSNWKAATLLGGLMLVGGNGLVTWGEQFVASGITAVLITTMPLWLVALDATIFRGPKPGLWQVVGLLVGVGGVVVLVDPGNGAVTPLGALAMLLAAFSWANGSLLNRTADLPESPWMATAIQMLAGGVLLIGIATAMGEWARFDVGAISLRSFAALLYLIFIGAILTFSAFVYLMRVRPAAEVATYAFVNPVIAILLGWLAGEALGPRALVGSMLIVGAVVLIHWAKHRPRRPRSSRADDGLVHRRGTRPSRAPAVEAAMAPCEESR